ncbi:uncharacterized protein [Aegilops tauschii subsp. strangulata]|uniref:uncharacterized protein isoform X2 n=1 Tax=Aegilops tauschii subsp. strangulata TaxID=200361 RepID=UPI001E1CA01D|nr:uncharacterized protein LOC109732054 isoform X2 [Aegilops tauschii subsp. strangulata]
MISLLRLVTTSFLILYVKCHKLILRLCVLFLSLIIFQVQGLQYHLDILKSENLISPNWKDFDVSKWKIVEQLQQPIQKDSSSCGLFMLKFMEYWTGYALSYPITQELVGGICSYIQSIAYTEILEKVWVQSSNPYTIRLTLKKLQTILKDDSPTDPDCFNMVVCKFMFDDIQTAKKKKGLISKHYLDMQFWGTVWLSYYPLHVYMGRWKTAFTISKGWIRTQGTNFGTSSNIRGQ